MALEYRVCWNASSNITFSGATDWEPWVADEDDGPQDVEDVLSAGRMECEGLLIALEESGFDWHVETREAG